MTGSDSNSISWWLVALVLGTLWYGDHGRQESVRKVYFSTCAEFAPDGACKARSAGPVVSFRAIEQTQEVIVLPDDGTPSRLANCTVFDRDNWQCPGTIFGSAMADGKYSGASTGELLGASSANRFVWYYLSATDWYKGRRTGTADVEAPSEFVRDGSAIVLVLFAAAFVPWRLWRWLVSRFPRFLPIVDGKPPFDTRREMPRRVLITGLAAFLVVGTGAAILGVGMSMSNMNAKPAVHPIKP